MDDRNYSLSDLPERIEVKIQLGEASCWIWHGTIRTTDGYGVLRWEGRTRLAHRVVYELLVGSIPASYVLDHLCCVRRCVNPAHLEPVTFEENARRGGEKRRRDTCKRGHPRVADRNGNRYCRECKREYYHQRREDPVELARQQTKNREYGRQYRQRPEVKQRAQEYLRDYRSDPEHRRAHNAKQRARARRRQPGTGQDSLF